MGINRTLSTVILWKMLFIYPSFFSKVCIGSLYFASDSPLSTMYIDPLSRNILRELCTDSRITATELASKLNISRYVATQRVKALESELGLHYTIEPNYSKLGIEDLHVIRVSFSKKPKDDELKQIFGGSRIAQVVATVKGGYDLLIFTAAESSQEYLEWETSLDFKFSKYGVTLNPSTIGIMHLGFIPINNALIQHLDIDDTYKKILLELNKNSRSQIREIGKSVGMSEYLVRYYMEKIKNEGFINRYTALVTKSPLKYNIAYFARYTVADGVVERVKKERNTMYWKKLDEMPVVSEFQIMWSISGSDRAFTVANYDDYRQGMKNSVLAHNKVYSKDKPRVVFGVIDNVLLGYFPIRNIDTKANYNTLLWSGDIF